MDRVSRMKEYDEKQKEIVKNQNYQEMARQLKKHQLTTIASLAKAHGVFNRNPNQRNPNEDDEDNDPLAHDDHSQHPSARKYSPRGGGGGPPGDDGSDDPDHEGGGDYGDQDDRKKKKKKPEILGLRNVPFHEEDGSIPLKMY